MIKEDVNVSVVFFYLYNENEWIWLNDVHESV